MELRVLEIVGVVKKRKSEVDVEGVVVEKIVKKEVLEFLKELFVDFNEVFVEEDVEEVNIMLFLVIEFEDDEFVVFDVKENIVFGVDDYDEKIDGKGLSKFLFFSVFFFLFCDDYV